MLKDITDRYPHCIPQNRNSYHPPEDFVIPPPPQKGADARELKKKTIIYMVDSRDRDMNKYPDPANYKIELNDEYKDIQEIELISAQLPSVSYTINSNNDLLHLKIGNKKYTISCLHGYYQSGALLAKSIQESLHMEPILKTITVNYNSRLHKLVFIQNRQSRHAKPIQAPISLCFEQENIRKECGSDKQEPKKYPPESIGNTLGFKPSINNGFFGRVSLLPIGNKNMFYIRSQSESNPSLSKILIRPTYDNEHVDTVDNSNHDLDDTSDHNSDYDSDSQHESNLDSDLDDSMSNKMPANESTPSPDAEPFTRTVEYIYLKDTSTHQEEWFKARIIKKLENQCIQDIDTWQICIENKDYATGGIYELWVDYIISPNLIDLEPHKYVLLKIPKLKRYQSNDSLVMESFAKLPLQSPELMFNHVNALGVIKYLNPPLPRLDALHIQFYPHTGCCDKYKRRVFDFQGSDHILIFAFVFYKQSLKYKE